MTEMSSLDLKARINQEVVRSAPEMPIRLILRAMYVIPELMER